MSRLDRLAEAAAAYTACVDLMQIIALHPDKLAAAIEAFGKARLALEELAEAAEEVG